MLFYPCCYGRTFLVRLGIIMHTQEDTRIPFISFKMIWWFLSPWIVSHASLKFCESSGILSSCKCKYNWSRLFKSFFVASLIIVFYLPEWRLYKVAFFALSFRQNTIKTFALAISIFRSCPRFLQWYFYKSYIYFNSYLPLSNLWNVLQKLQKKFIEKLFCICYNADRQNEASSPWCLTTTKTPVLQHWGLLFPF